MANKIQPISNFLPESLKGKYDIINSSGDPLESTNPVFAIGKFRPIDVSKLSEAKINSLIRQNHPSFVRIEKSKVASNSGKSGK